MAGNSVILSISSPKQLVEWLDAVDMSPSEIFQQAVLDKKTIWERYNNDAEKLRKTIKVMEVMLQEYNQYFEETGKREEFGKWRAMKTQNVPIV